MAKNPNANGDIIPKGYRQGQMQNFDPQQMELYKSQFANVGPDSYLSKLASGDQSYFDELEAPAHRQFNEKLGGIASRFSGMGMGGRKSSGFQNETSSAASNFAQDLQSKRLGLRNEAIESLMSMSNQLLGQRPQNKFLVEKQQKQGFDWGGLAGAGLGAVGGFFAGGPTGTMTGASMGYGIGSGKGGGSDFQSSEGWKPSWNGQG